MKKRIKRYVAQILYRVLTRNMHKEYLQGVFEKDSSLVIEALGPFLYKQLMLDTMPFDLDVNKDAICFENLTGLFASTVFDHGVISMTVRQAGYLFGLIKEMSARKIVEIGRYKGGSTIVMASAMKNVGGGQMWSIDRQDKEQRLYADNINRSFDEQLQEIITRLALDVTLIVGDSKSINVETGLIDLAFIDGDHSYEGVKNDFERFGRRLRVGGALVFDDAFDQNTIFFSHSDTVGKLVREIMQQGDFKFVKKVDRMAHLERII